MAPPRERGSHTLIEAAPDAIVGVDSAGRIAFLNAAAEHMFGQARADLLGQPFDVLVPESPR